MLPTKPTSNADLAAALLRAGCIRFGRFTLKSGLVSPIYLDLRRLASFPADLQTVAAAYLPLLEPLAFDHLAAVPYTGLPIGTAISLALGRSMIYPRREVKDHGTQVAVEGVFEPGQTAVVVDDVATTGLSTLEGIVKLRGAGLVVQEVVVLIDREQGAAEALERAGCRLRAVMTLRQTLSLCVALGAVREQQVTEFLSTPS